MITLPMGWFILLCIVALVGSFYLFACLWVGLDYLINLIKNCKTYKNYYEEKQGGKNERIN